MTYLNIEMVTASAADLWDPMLGCLDASLFAGLVSDFVRIRVSFWRPLTTSGVCCKALVPFGLHWTSHGAQLRYLGLGCRRDTDLGGFAGFCGQKVGQPVAGCGP